MSIYINIDTNPDPDCLLGHGGSLIYVLHPPSDKSWSLEWCDEDDDASEELLCNLFNGYRLMEGCLHCELGLPSNVQEICTEHDIVINKIGERLEDC